VNVSGCDGGGGYDYDKMGDGDPFKATRTYLKINQKLEWLRVNDVDKTANDRTVFWIKLNVRCVGHFSFKIILVYYRQNDYLLPQQFGIYKYIYKNTYLNNQPKFPLSITTMI